jgi:hypothetical protein
VLVGWLGGETSMRRVGRGVSGEGDAQVAWWWVWQWVSQDRMRFMVRALPVWVSLMASGMVGWVGSGECVSERMKIT